MGKQRGRTGALRSLTVPMGAVRDAPKVHEEPPTGEMPVFLRTTRASTIVECDAALSTLLEVSSAMLIGKPLAVFVDMWDRPQFRERLASFPADARCEDWRFHLRIRGRTVPVIATVAAVSSLAANDSRPGLRWKLREERSPTRAGASLTEQAQGIRQEENERVLARIAHEIGQPLAAIVAYARGCLMRSKAEALTRPELERALEQVVNEALRAGAIMHEARNPKVKP